MGARRRLIQPPLFVVVCLWVLAIPAPAVGADRLPTPAGWPLSGSPVVQRGFDPPALAWASGHRGVDLAAKPGQAVLAAAEGTVAFVGSIAGKPVISIDHGSVRTTYEPVISTLHVGDRVGLGQVIGQLGNGGPGLGGPGLGGPGLGGPGLGGPGLGGPGLGGPGLGGPGLGGPGFGGPGFGGPGLGGHCHDCLHWGLREGKKYLDPLLLLGNRGGRLRLVAEAQRKIVKREAEARAAAAPATQAGATTSVGRPGSHGFLHPVAGPVTSGFGMRLHPLLKIWKLHDGTDFGAACGTAIRAPYAGAVVRAYYNPAYGNRLFLSHGRVDGVRVETAFNHATRYLVRPGERVTRGQVIGLVGRTGWATGCHLHLMVWLNGRLSNPMNWL